MIVQGLKPYKTKLTSMYNCFMLTILFLFKSHVLCFSSAQFRKGFFQIRSLKHLPRQRLARWMVSMNEPQSRHQETLKQLLNATLNRVERTLSSKSCVDIPGSTTANIDGTIRNLITEVQQRYVLSDESDAKGHVKSNNVESLLSGISDRAKKVLMSNSELIATSLDESSNSDVAPTEQSTAVVDNDDTILLDYLRNPTITTTALAHSLWSYVLRPDVDTVIDATAGNGGDTVVLARLLFSSAYNQDSSTSVATTETEKARPCKAQLLAVDIQEQACQNTTLRLETMLPPNIMRNNVEVLHTSHAPLPIPRDTTSVALVVYNLGFLPKSTALSRDCTTRTETTIAALSDAAPMLRIGGMLSVMTYPRTNRQEDFCVRAFLEVLALFSSATVSWEEYVQALDCSASLKERLAAALKNVLEKGRRPTQKWRVHEHKKLGRIDAPILFTATRIQ